MFNVMCCFCANYNVEMSHCSLGLDETEKYCFSWKPDQLHTEPLPPIVNPCLNIPTPVIDKSTNIPLEPIRDDYYGKE